ncbi:MAG TPA: hypothetical protein VFO49_13035 [Nocardioides sp.]|nr:hypothetical protein [Nocardioides sp.]
MPDLRVDPLLSYARRSGETVKLVLGVEGEAPSASGLALRLHDEQGQHDVPVTITENGPGRFRIDAVVDNSEVGEGTWRMKLVDPSTGGRHNLQTRVLIRADMPVALLPGRPPRTVLPEPEPAPRG